MTQLLRIVLLAAICSGCTHQQNVHKSWEPWSSGDLVVALVTDWAGQIDPVQDPNALAATGGVEALSIALTSRREIVEANSLPYLTVFAGDLLFGDSALSIESDGLANTTLLNVMKPELVALSSRVLNYPPEVLRDLISTLDSEVILGNVEADLGVESHYTFVLYGRRITATSVICEEQFKRVSPDPYARFVDPEKKIKQIARRTRLFRRSALVVFADCSFDAAAELARQKEVDMVVVVGSRAVFAEPYYVDSTPIIAAGSRGEVIGEGTVAISPAGIELLDFSTFRVRPSEGQIDQNIRIALAGLEDEYPTYIRVGYTEQLLDGRIESIRTQQTNLGSVVTQAMLSSQAADIALINSGAIRKSIPPGVITAGSINEVLPFSDTLLLVNVPGGAIRDAVCHGLNSRGDLVNGAFLQVSGIEVSVNGPSCEEVLVTRSGVPIEEEDWYRLAVPDYMYYGGDSYGFLREAGKDVVATDTTIRKLLRDYLLGTDEIESYGNPYDFRDDD